MKYFTITLQVSCPSDISERDISDRIESNEFAPYISVSDCHIEEDIEDNTQSLSETEGHQPGD